MITSIEIPNYGLANDRENLPQIKSASAFLRFLRANHITYSDVVVPAHELKPSQSNFNKEKIASLMGGSDTSQIIISADNFILDGHHRFLADYNLGKPCRAIRVDKNILDLIALGRTFEAEKKSRASVIKESITHEKLRPYLDHFVKFAAKHLDLKEVPHINLKSSEGSFGGYNPSTGQIDLATANRHPMDIFRTAAHEITHYKQDKDGRIKDPAVDGATGSDIENEANAEAGKIMRLYAKDNKSSFSLQHVSEGLDITDPSNREWGKKSLVDIYKAGTPGEGKKVRKKKPNIKRIANDDNDGIGPMTQFTGSPLNVSWGTGTIYEEGVRRWAENAVTQQKFIEKYGEELGMRRLTEAAQALIDPKTQKS